MPDGSGTPLFRPVGLYELVHVAASGYRAFPPRLPEQPIFYPVLNQTYAEEIARRWNPPDPNSGFAGFVTRFMVRSEALAPYPVRVVGAERHRELWVPAEHQATFQEAFDGPIEVVAAWAGERFAEALPSWQGSPGPVSGEDLASLLALIEAGPIVGGPRTITIPERP